MATVETINPNIDGSTVDPKWIDGGPHNTTPTYTGPAFDVDQPYMWVPSTVISGLVSGYCERRAIMDPVFITGTTTEIVDGESVLRYTNTYWGGINNKAKITSYGVNNIETGTPFDSLFYSSTPDASMRPVGVSGSTTTDYMTAMDSALTALCTVFVDEKRDPYARTGTNGFDILAQSAVLRAGLDQDTTSSIGTPVQNGGTMRDRMASALPVEWAKERKWMLDELRYIDPYGNIRQAIVEPIDYPLLSGTYTKDTTISLNVEQTAYATIAGVFPTYIEITAGESTGNVYAGYQLLSAIDGALYSTGEVCYYLDLPIDALGINLEADYIDYTNENTQYISDTRFIYCDDYILAYYVLPGGHIIIPRGTFLEHRPITVEAGGIVEYVETLVRQPETYYHAGSIVKYPDNNEIMLYTTDSGVTGTGTLPENIAVGATWQDGDILWNIADPDYDQSAMDPKIYLHNGAEFRPLVKDNGGYKTIDLKIDKLYNGHTCVSFIGSGYTTLYISGSDVPTAQPSGYSRNMFITGGAVVTLGEGYVPDSVAWLYVSGATVNVPRNCYFNEITVAEGGCVNIEAGRAAEEYTDLLVLSGGIASFTATNNQGGTIADTTILSGGTLSFSGVINDYTDFGFEGLAITDGAVITGTCTTQDGHTAAELVEHLMVLHFDDFGLIGASTVGWKYNNIQITDASQAVNKIYGEYTYSEAVQAVTDHVNDNLPDNTNITIDVAIDGTTYSSVDAWSTSTGTRTTFYYGTCIAAANKQGGPLADNYYPSFRCRQWYNDKNTHSNSNNQ